jgi:protein arginine N-methyltransferase 1
MTPITAHIIICISYISIPSHENILKDKERIMPFINAIRRNKHLFENKTVLEINCGTAILSILAAQQGAKHVYAVTNIYTFNFTTD